MSECQKYQGASLKHDISFPISELAKAIPAIIKDITAYLPEIRPMPFGHIGDGNLHFNFSKPIAMDDAEFMSHEDAINQLVFAQVQKFKGSFSAEHGIGQLRRGALKNYLSPACYDLLYGLKQHLDPQKILNHGKMFL